MVGWIRIHRKICDHPFFKERRVFSRFEAWLDLLLSANHKDHRFVLGSEIIEAQRGQIITSELTLMERWRWSKSKVRRYIKNLEDERMVIKKADSKKTSLFIVNYDTYQKTETAEEPQKDHRKTAERPQTIHNQENKKGNKGKKTSKTLVKRDTPFHPTDPDDEEFHFDYGWSSEERATLMVDMWNSLCTRKDVGLLGITLTPERMTLIESKLIEVPGFLYEWANILGMIALRSPFLRGDNFRGWKADFDWVLQGDNWRMILDDKFLDPEGAIKAFLGDVDDPGTMPPVDGNQRQDPESPDQLESRREQKANPKNSDPVRTADKLADDTLEESLSRDSSEDEELLPRNQLSDGDGDEGALPPGDDGDINF